LTEEDYSSYNFLLARMKAINKIKRKELEEKIEEEQRKRKIIENDYLVT